VEPTVTGLTRHVGMHQFATAGVILGSGLLVGLVLSRVLRARLRHNGLASRWAAVRAAQGVVLVASTAVGVYGASLALPLTPGLANFVRQSVAVVLLFCATVFAARLAAATVQHYAQRSDGSGMFGSIFLNITRLIVFVVGVLVILQTLGISITPMLTALGVGGLAVALALKDTLANLFSGIHLIAAKYIRGGDYVRLDSGEEGYVVDINWRHTSLRQLPDNLILVPNARLATAVLTNYHEPQRGLQVAVHVGVSYDSDLELVERVTVEVGREVMREVPGGDPDFEPWVWFGAFGSSSIDLTVYLRAAEFYDQYPVRHAFVKRLHARYREEGIEIPYPIQTLRWEGDGRGTALLRPNQGDHQR
jgi:small-conductance mechanosensitive channel